MQFHYKAIDARNIGLTMITFPFSTIIMPSAEAEQTPAWREYHRVLGAFADLGNEPDNERDVIELLERAFSGRYAEFIFRGPGVPPFEELQRRVQWANERWKKQTERGAMWPRGRVLREIQELAHFADIALIAGPFAPNFGKQRIA